MADIPVLIVGAGPAGLVSALFLAQNGIKPRIIDKDDAFHVGSRGFGVQPRTFELFQILGILPDVQKHSTPIPTMRAYKLPGGTVPVKTWDLYEKGEVWPDRPFANGACLSQDTLESILRSHLSKYGIEVELGIGLVGIGQTDEHVIASLAPHKGGNVAGPEEKVTAGYLLGCDGARGSTRKLLGLTFQGETRDSDGMVWGDVEIDGLTNDFWHIWGKPGHFTIMARPLDPLNTASKKFGIGITGQNFNPTELASPAKTVDFIHRETGRRELKFGEFSWLSYFKPNMRMVNKFQEGRAFVVGDAAHVHSPTGGQGMNCSVQDACNISWKLALVLKALAPPKLLETYNEERLPVIAQMLHATTALYTHTVKALPEGEGRFEPHTPVGVGGADSAAAKGKEEGKENEGKENEGKENEGKENEEKEKEKQEPKSSWFKWRNNALQMYSINYRFSSIVLDTRSSSSLDKEKAKAYAYAGYEGTGSLCAGDRAPEAPLVDSQDKEGSLFGIFRVGKHTVLVFGSEEGVEESDVVQSFRIVKEGGGGKGNVLLDKDGHAYSAYRVEEGEKAFVVVRPDGFVGAIGESKEVVGRYFEGLGMKV